MSDLRLPSAFATHAGELAVAIMDRHGGRSRMTMVDLEVVASMTKVLAAMRSAKPEDLPRLVDSLSKLEQMLPAPPEHSPLDQLDAHCAGVPS